MTPGSAIAHYRITAKLGEGGMGAVYRATDTRLNRDVAIKVLPPAFAEGTGVLESSKYRGHLWDRTRRHRDGSGGGTGIEAGIPQPLFQFGTGTRGNRFGVTADGQRFVVAELLQKEELDKPELTVVLNWAAEMKLP